MKKTVVNNLQYGPHNPFARPEAVGTTITTGAQFTEAVVVDVVLNDSHPEYAKDGYNIGAIKFRSLKNDMYRPVSALNWALPIDSNFSEYPLRDEIVLVVSLLNRWYYTKKINVSSRVTAQTLPGINDEMDTIPTKAQIAKDLRKSEANPIKSIPTTGKLGKQFIDLPSVRRLRHDEGDILVEGRSGQSIRMGAAWKSGTLFKSAATDQSPNILLRVGPVPSKASAPLGLASEDINLDAASLWLVSDQTVPLSLATEKNTVHKSSISDFPVKLDGSQIIINANRVILNSRTDKILGHSAKGIHWTSNLDFTVDAGRDYVSRIMGRYKLTVGKEVVISAPKLMLGGEKNMSPVALGDLLAEFLTKLLDAHISSASSYVMTSTGPGALNPGLVAKLTKLKAEILKNAVFNSKTVFITK